MGQENNKIDTLLERTEKTLRVRKRLGEMLLEAGLIEKTQLDSALVSCKRAGKKLGQYLVREGIISEDAVVKLICDQLKIERYNPQKYSVEQSFSQLIDVDTARKLHVIPVDKQRDLITIAMVDPLDIKALDYIEIQVNTEVESVMCTEQEFKLLFSSIYGSYAGKDGVMENLQEMEILQGAEDVDVKKKEQVTQQGYSANSLQDMIEEAPVVSLVNSIIAQAVREHASDIHLSPERDYVEIRFRVDGKLYQIPPPPKAMFPPIVSRLKILANLDISISRIPQDGRFTVFINDKEINIRVSTIPTIYGENVVLRLLDTGSGIYSLKQLGMSPKDIQTIEKMVRMPYGMILCTGPTGSGKSTSLFAMLKIINTPDINIITLEDPVEYRMEHVRQVQLNKNAGMAFASGLRSILRQDPDVIMIGEIRDSETAGVAVQSALTGHMVMSTVHTNGAAGAITRFIDMGIEPFLVSSVMLVIVAQRLIRKVCPHCSAPYTPQDAVLKFWGLEHEKALNFVHGKGCFQCKQTGYMGRTGLYEVLLINEAVREMILAGTSAQAMTKACTLSGELTTLKQDAALKVAQGITTSTEAASAIMM